MELSPVDDQPSRTEAIPSPTTAAARPRPCPRRRQAPCRQDRCPTAGSRATDPRWIEPGWPTGADGSRACTSRSAGSPRPTRWPRSTTGGRPASSSTATIPSHRSQPMLAPPSTRRISSTTRVSGSRSRSSPLPHPRPEHRRFACPRATAATRSRSAAIGRIAIPFDDGPRTLAVYWMSGYTGGLFIPFRDATNGSGDLWRRALPRRWRQERRSGW